MVSKASRSLVWVLIISAVLYDDKLFNTSLWDTLLQKAVFDVLYMITDIPFLSEHKEKIMVSHYHA